MSLTALYVWRGDQVCHCLEKEAEAWYSLKRGAGARGALWRVGHEPPSVCSVVDFTYYL